jgi:hypothetical protein
MLKVIVWGDPVPVPCSMIVCVAEGLALSALSVNVAAPGMEPPVCGVKLTLKLQLAPDASR